MKFNWGTGAFILFGSFAAFMIGLVIFASQQNHDLVTEDYYEKELEFKDILERKETTFQLKEQLSWSIKEEMFIITFPEDVSFPISAKVSFFKPSNSNDDIAFSFETTNPIHSISLSEFSSGMYKAKIEWAVDGENYYNEYEVMVP